jgi:hypothetical protein
VAHDRQSSVPPDARATGRPMDATSLSKPRRARYERDSIR